MTDFQNQSFLRSFRHSAISMDVKDVLEIKKIASEVLSFKLFKIELYMKYFGAPFECYLVKGWTLLDYLWHLVENNEDFYLGSPASKKELKRCISKDKALDQLKFEVIIFGEQRIRFLVPASTKVEQIITFDPGINPYQRIERIVFKTSQKYSKTAHPQLKVKDVEPVLLNNK